VNIEENDSSGSSTTSSPSSNVPKDPTRDALLSEMKEKMKDFTIFSVLKSREDGVVIEGRPRLNTTINVMTTEKYEFTSDPPPVPRKPRFVKKSLGGNLSIRNRISVKESFDLYMKKEDVLNLNVKKFQDVVSACGDTDKLNNQVSKVHGMIKGFLSRKVYGQRVKDVKYRENVANEIYETEIRYVDQLEYLIKLFFDPLGEDARQQQRLMEENEVRTVFSSIKIIYNCNMLLKEDIKARIDNWAANVKVGDIFVKMTEYLKIYTQYITSYDLAIQTLINCRKKNKRLDQWIEETENNPNLNGLKIGSLLILPIQRIPRYSLLLRDMLKHTWEDHIDYKNLEECTTQMESVATYLNNKKAEAENITKVNDLFSNFSGGNFNELADPTRRYVGEEIFRVQTDKGAKPRKLYLFNDIIIIAKINKKGQLLKGNNKERADIIFQLVHVEVNHVSSTMFSISYPELSVTYQFVCESERQKIDWIEIIQNTASVYKGKISLRRKIIQVEK